MSFDGEQLEAVYTFPAELCDWLDEAAERQLRDDGNVLSEGEPSADESSDAEESTQAPSAEQRARDERCARRADASAQRSAAAEQRQQSLQEVLVHREAERPDRAPTLRPRREQSWSREAAWEASARARTELGARGEAL